MFPLVKKRTFWVGSVLAIACIALFSTLGFWQWGRASWKQQFIVDYTAALGRPALPLWRALAQPTLPRRIDLADVPPPDAIALPLNVDGRGRYDGARTVLLDNQRRGDRVGVNVLSVARVDGSDRALLVDRGWVPLDAARRPTLALTPPADDIALVGLLVAPPAAGLRWVDLPPIAADAAPALLPYLDLDVVGAAFGVALAPAVLKLAPDVDGGFTRDREALPNTLPPEQHRGYAVQWWGMALATLVIWLVLVVRTARRDERSTVRS